MNVRKLNELFMTIQFIQESNLTSKYKEEIRDFEEKLKGYLYAFFGNNLKFIPNETIGCIRAYYKGIGFVINISNGISLTIMDSKYACLLEEFELIFKAIVGKEKTFIYQYNTENNSCSVFEWSFDPEQRIYELRKNKNINILTDYYTAGVIKELGEQLLSMDGYKRLFENNKLDNTYGIVQIQKMYPNLRTCMLQSWASSCRSQLTLTKNVC